MGTVMSGSPNGSTAVAAEETSSLIRTPADGTAHKGVVPTGGSLLLAELPRWATRRSITVALLSASCCVEAFGYTICVPFLTTHLRSTYGISESRAGLVFISYTVGSVASTPLVEAVIGAVDCNGAICASLVALGVSQVAFIFAPTVSLLVAARFVGGVGAGMTWSTVLTACHHLSGTEEGGEMGALFGIVLSAVSVGTMAGPALGGALYSYGGWSVPFACVTLICFGGAAAVAAFLPSFSRAHAGGPPHCKGGACGSAAIELVLVLVLVMAGGVLFSSIDTVLPMDLEDRFQGSSVLSGTLFLAVAVCYGAAAPYFGAMADRLGNGLLLASAATVTLSAALVGFAHATARWQLFAVAVVFGASGTAQLTPASTLLEEVVPVALHDHPTFGYALFNCAYVTGMAVGPGTLSALTESLGFGRASVVLGVVTTACAVVAAVGIRVARDRRADSSAV